MTITAQRLLTELGNRAWSGFNADDMQWDNTESTQAKTELNIGVRHLINRVDFPFKRKEKTLTTTANMPTYSMPDGQLLSIENNDTHDMLTFLGSGDKKNKTTTGEPEYYWIQYKNPSRKLRLYPIPDKAYNYTVTYSTFKPVMTQDSELAMEFANADDYINLPSTLEHLFMDCLVLETMITNNKDDTDENFQPMKDEFAEKWRVFKRTCKPARTESYCIGL